MRPHYPALLTFPIAFLFAGAFVVLLFTFGQANLRFDPAA